jgi:hypothetical protein
MIMPKERVKIPSSIRSQVLIENQHSCCICGKSGVQIHHINANPSDNSLENLAVLCLPHHDEATNITGLSAKLKSAEIRKYKENWEFSCKERTNRAIRSFNTFFMLDYKNAERIRQVYSQLSTSEYKKAYEILTSDFQEEEIARRKSKYFSNMEPNTSWNEHTKRLLEAVLEENPHPKIFQNQPGHPADPFYPDERPVFANPLFGYYDIWCQIMVRAILSVREAFNLEDLTRLGNPMQSNLEGSIVAFKAKVKGEVFSPSKWRTNPIGYTELIYKNKNVTWRSQMKLKTHYVYSVTASEDLSDGNQSGLLILRSIERVNKGNYQKEIIFKAIPLIMGFGGLEL